MRRDVKRKERYDGGDGRHDDVKIESSTDEMILKRGKKQNHATQIDQNTERNSARTRPIDDRIHKTNEKGMHEMKNV